VAQQQREGCLAGRGVVLVLKRLEQRRGLADIVLDPLADLRITSPRISNPIGIPPRSWLSGRSTSPSRSSYSASTQVIPPA
jgi:hypothetical protein